LVIVQAVSLSARVYHDKPNCIIVKEKGKDINLQNMSNTVTVFDSSICAAHALVVHKNLMSAKCISIVDVNVEHNNITSHMFWESLIFGKCAYTAKM
jgi:hypothetical protein